MIDPVYPIIWMDTIHYKVTDERGCFVSRAIYNVLGILTRGITLDTVYFTLPFFENLKYYA